MGPMKDFNVSCFIECAKELLRADETARAMWLLDNLPAFYRDQTPGEIVDLRNEVARRVATPAFYAHSIGVELDTTRNVHLHMPNSLRGKILINDVKMMNEAGLIPHIIDNGAGEFWTPAMLKHEGLQFTYKPIYLNHLTYQTHESNFYQFLKEKPSEKEPLIFFACEIIEHLWKEEELKHNMLRYAEGRFPDIIHVSTPMYTFDTDCMDWRSKDDLGHLRAYTPVEFFMTVHNIFPEYTLVNFKSQILHSRGVLPTSQFEVVTKTHGQDTLNL